MSRKLRISVGLYLAAGLTTLGLQIPIRLDACAGVGACLASLTTAPFWALIWPAYLAISGLVSALVLRAFLFFSLPLLAAGLLVAAWTAWAHGRRRPSAGA